MSVKSSNYHDIAAPPDCIPLRCLACQCHSTAGHLIEWSTQLELELEHLIRDAAIARFGLHQPQLMGFPSTAALPIAIRRNCWGSINRNQAIYIYLYIVKCLFVYKLKYSLHLKLSIQSE